MLARIGIKIYLLAQTKSKYFAKVLLQAGNNTSMYLLGWTPSSIDAANSLTNLRSEEHTSELQSLMRISYAVFCLKKKKNQHYKMKRHQIQSDVLAYNHRKQQSHTTHNSIVNTI